MLVVIPSFFIPNSSCCPNYQKTFFDDNCLQIQVRSHILVYRFANYSQPILVGLLLGCKYSHPSTNYLNNVFKVYFDYYLVNHLLVLVDIICQSYYDLFCCLKLKNYVEILKISVPTFVFIVISIFTSIFISIFIYVEVAIYF